LRKIVHAAVVSRVTKCTVLDILGIGVGKLSIALERVDFALGDTFPGVLELQLTEPLEAKRLVVGVEASQRVVTTRRESIGYRRDVAWRFEKQLEGEGRFSDGTWPFTLRLPHTLEQSGQLPDSLLGDLAQVVSFFQPSKRFPLEWSVLAFLDRPWKVNLKGRVAITVSASKAGGKRPRKKRATS
jgi:hypothetical protein